MIRNTVVAAVALCLGCVAPAAAFAAETISFGGTLANGNNQSNGPFGAVNNNYQGTSYSVTLSYDPSAFTKSYAVDSCGTASGTSCYFTLSAATPVTEVITVNGISKTYTVTAGGFNLTSSPGNYDFNFSFQGPNGLSMSGDFVSATSIFPNSANVNNPVLADLTNAKLKSGTFNQSGTGYSVGSNPTNISATLGAVPEPASWAMMILGMGGVGLALRRRRNTVRMSYAA